MNSNKLSFQELKSRVSVIDVASFLGYKFDRSKGMSQPSFVLTDAGGDVTDRIYIKNPRDNSTKDIGDVMVYNHLEMSLVL